MNVAMSLCEHEVPLAIRWFEWVSELGGTVGHKLFLLPTEGTRAEEVIALSNKAFPNAVTILQDDEKIKSDWQSSAPARSAAGANSSFRQVAWYFYLNKFGYWFWCEFDCIPTKKEWLDRLEKEYQHGSKPFMGAHVLIDRVPEHMSGNAIYAQDTPALAPTLVMHTNWISEGREYELAFDIAGAQETLKQAHFTNVIQHCFRHKGFKTREEFDALIDPNAVVFHSNKDGSIYNYLGKQHDPKMQAIVDRYFDEYKNLSGVGENTKSVREASASTQSLERKEGDANERTGTLSNPDDRARCEDSGTQAGAGTSETGVRETPAKKTELNNAALTVQSAGAATFSFCGSDEPQQALEHEPSGLPSISEPWKNRADSEQEVRLLCSALALFCKAPVYKARVRAALREAKIIK